jgi:hypothetical protein
MLQKGERMTFSLNNRLVLETYTKKALEAKVQGGIATPNQKDGVKGLRVLVEATLNDGRHIPVGSTAYIREKTLYEQAWANTPLSCDTIPVKFVLADLQFVEFISTPEEVA